MTLEHIMGGEFHFCEVRAGLLAMLVSQGMYYLGEY